MHKCFMVTEIPTVTCSVIITEKADTPCQNGFSWHRAQAEYARYERASVEERAQILGEIPEGFVYPTCCSTCGRPFGPEASVGKSAGPMWRRDDTGEIKSRPGDFGPGAMWYSSWLAGYMAATWENWPVGQAPLSVMTPGGEWIIESRARNCTLPNDRVHRCWCVHRTAPDIHVDKQGLTCSAGAGSIQTGDYHGFLHNGSLT